MEGLKRLNCSFFRYDRWTDQSDLKGGESLTFHSGGAWLHLVSDRRLPGLLHSAQVNWTVIPIAHDRFLLKFTIRLSSYC
jgi:hypothetical protein